MNLKSFHKLRRGFVVVLAGSLLLSSRLVRCQDRRHAVEPDEVLRYISEHGARKAVGMLTKGNGFRWREVEMGVQTGKPAWTHVAGALLSGTDADTTKDLEFSLAIALTHNAEGVLRLVGPNLKVASVCSIPYIEAPAAVNKNFTRRALASVLKVGSPQLGLQKEACLTSLRSGDQTR